MDKFGIFKLIGSLADFYKTHGYNFFSNNQNSKNLQKKEQNSVVLTDNASQNPRQPHAQTTPNVLPKPLQENMIKIMNGHDEFIKRVTSSVKKN